VRINTKSGKPKIIDYDPSQWFFVAGAQMWQFLHRFEWLNDEYDAVPFDGKSWLLTSEEEIKTGI
jgi:hypothetical protein